MRKIVQSCIAVLVFGLFLVVTYYFMYSEPSYLLPSWATKLEPKDLIQAENSARMTLVQTIGGAALLISILFTWRSGRATQANAELAADKQITEVFSKAIEQIGNKSMTVRIGGVLALGRIARQSRKDHWAIMEILTAHLREMSSDKDEQMQFPSSDGPAVSKEDSNSRKSYGVSSLRSEAKAIVEVLRLRNSEYETDEQRLNLEKANLEGMDLSGADLRRARFIGADLRRAKLSRARLDNADFSGSKLCDADLTEVCLIGTNLIGADLERAILIGVDLRGASTYAINLSGASLIECKTEQRARTKRL